MFLGRGFLSTIFGLSALVWLVYVMLATTIIEEDGRLDRACMPIDFAGNLARSITDAIHPPTVPDVQQYTISLSRGCELALYRLIDDEKVTQCENDVAAFKRYLSDLSKAPEYQTYVDSWVEYFHGKRFWVVCEKHSEEWRPFLEKGNYYSIASVGT